MNNYQLKTETRKGQLGYVVINTKSGRICNELWFEESCKDEAIKYRDTLEALYGDWDG